MVTNTEPPGAYYVRQTGHAWCAFYNGVVSNRVCAAGVKYREVATNQHGQAALRASQTHHYPCALHCGGSDSCSRRRLIGPEELD